MFVLDLHKSELNENWMREEFVLYVGRSWTSDAVVVRWAAASRPLTAGVRAPSACIRCQHI